MAPGKNQVSPEVAAQLVEVARQMRELVYGQDAIPVWGTKFSQIESDCLSIGGELARLRMEQSVEGPAQRVPGDSRRGPAETAALIGTRDSPVETPAGDVSWKQPQAHLSTARRDFCPSGPSVFPQAQALGMDVDREFSPSLPEKLTPVGALLKSFPQGSTAGEKLRDLVRGRKRLERLTERIGAERVEQREPHTAAVQPLTLRDQLKGPEGVVPPVACAVMADGGRFQKTDRHPDSKTQWSESQAGRGWALGSRTEAHDPPPPSDPCPEAPSFLLNFEPVETLPHAIGQQAAAVSESAAAAGVDLNALPLTSDRAEWLAPARAAPATDSARELPLSPRVKRRDVVATFASSRDFGQMLVARAWPRGLFQALRTGVVGDGRPWIGKLWDREFPAFGFVPILDIIHALTYVFAAAMAGRSRTAGWAA